MDRTLLRRSREGDRKFTGSGYPHQRGSRGLQAREMSGPVRPSPAAPRSGGAQPGGWAQPAQTRARSGWASFGAAFFTSRLLDGRLLRRGPAARGRRGGRPALGQQFRCPLRGDRLDRIALAERGVVSPSVTYGPKRPSLTSIGRLLAGSWPSSRSGGAAPRAPAAPSAARRSIASSRADVNSCSPRRATGVRAPLQVGAYRPFCAVISPSGSPTMRGSDRASGLSR